MEIVGTQDTLRVRDSDLNAFSIKNANLAGTTIDGVLVSQMIRIHRGRPTG